jgi:hypothetical protein
VVAKDVMVPTRDGVRLSTDIYRPARDGEALRGQFPTILGRTSYNKENRLMWVEPVGEFFARRGYVVAVQDLRGRHKSEGTGQYHHSCNPHDGRDSYDTIEWLASQPWCSGAVGTLGSSQGAIFQQIAALHRPPHLAAMWPDAGPTNIYDHEAREGGAMGLHMFGALFLHAFDAQEIVGDRAAQDAILEGMRSMRALVQSMPFTPGSTPLAVVPNLEEILFNYYYHGEYDDFWAQECCDQSRYVTRHAAIPTCHSVGWWDPFVRGVADYYRQLREQDDRCHRLIIGPWSHGDIMTPATSVGDLEFGPDARWGMDRYQAEQLRWFDRWLKGVANDVEDLDPVEIFVMGGGDGRRTESGRLRHGGRWRTEASWPIERAQLTTFYLDTEGGLKLEAPEGSVAFLEFAFDPTRPTPTIAANVTGFYELIDVPAELEETLRESEEALRLRMRNIVPLGGADQVEREGLVAAVAPFRRLADRDDVLTFETTPLGSDTEVTGDTSVRLWVSSSATDTDFTAKLVDVYPPSEDYPEGYDLNLVDSIIRARYRESWTAPSLLEPGRIYEVEIRLPATSNLFTQGHRIRVEVSSSNFPRFDVNPNTGEPMGRHTRTEVAHNRVYADAEHPSHIVLPIVPESATTG